MAKNINIISESNYLREALESLEQFEIKPDAKLRIVDEGAVVRVGGDELKKPLSLADLIQSIESNLMPDELRIGDAVLYPKLRKIQCGADEIQLTEKESLLLTSLCEKTMTKEELLKSLWKTHDEIETNTLETHIYRLRQKLSDCGINDIVLKDGEFYSLKK